MVEKKTKRDIKRNNAKEHGTGSEKVTKTVKFTLSKDKYNQYHLGE